jgi:HK97 family phage major capsid protein
MTIKEMKDKRNQLLTQAQALVRKAEVTAEDRQSADRMLVEVDTIEADIAREERFTKFEAEQNSSVTPPRPIPGSEVTDTPEKRTAAEKRAFSNYVKYGVVDSTVMRSAAPLSGTELRDLGVGSVAGSITGGYQLVPQAFYPVLEDAQKAWGGLLNIVNTRETDNGAPMKIAFTNDTANMVTVIGEDTGVSESDPSISGVLSSTDFLTTGAVKVSLAELQDSAFDIDAFIRDSFGKRWFRGVNYLVTNGSSSGNVQSILGAGIVASPYSSAGVQSATTATVAYGDIAGLYAALDPAYEDNASFVFNSNTRGYLLKITDSLGRPLFIPAPNAGAFDMLLGKKVVLNQAMPNVGSGNVAVQYGDFKAGYMYRPVKPGLAIFRLNELYMASGMVGFIGYARAGGVIMDAGTHPIVALTVK